MVTVELGWVEEVKVGADWEEEGEVMVHMLWSSSGTAAAGTSTAGAAV
jgi:hypothetical protein